MTYVFLRVNQPQPSGHYQMFHGFYNIVFHSFICDPMVFAIWESYKSWNDFLEARKIDRCSKIQSFIFLTDKKRLQNYLWNLSNKITTRPQYLGGYACCDTIPEEL